MLKVANKKVTVIGLSKRTGVATARMLANKGASVVVSDVKNSDQLREEIGLLKDYNIDYDLGGHSEKSLNADLIVVSPGVPLNIPFFKEVKKRGIPVISEVELAYQFNKARIIAITGTNGKTTTTRLIGNILKNAKIGRVKIGGNIGNPLIGEVEDLGEKDWLVAEVSSFQLETIKDFRPKISIFLNFSPDHLDRHQTVENYWEAKKKIFINQKPEDHALINFDDSKVVKAAENCKAMTWKVSLKGEIDRGVYQQGDKLIYKEPGTEEAIIKIKEIPLIGEHNIQNVAFAILAAKITGVSNDIIRKGVSGFSPDSHRLEVIAEEEDGTLFVDDSKATNPDAAIKALLSFEQPIILIAGGQDRQADFNEFAYLISEKVKELILIGETSNKLFKEVVKYGFNENNIYMVQNMKEAVSMAFRRIDSGDCLLLSPGCPSWDMYTSYKERGNQFRNEVEKKRGNWFGH